MHQMMKVEGTRLILLIEKHRPSMMYFRCSLQKDIIPPAAVQAVRRIKQIFEEKGFSVKVTMSLYHECKEIFKNCPSTRAVLICVQRGPGRSGDRKGLSTFTVSGFVVDCAESEQSSLDSAFRLEEDRDECSLRLHLIPPINAHNHSPCTSLLRKELRTDILKHTQELRNGHYMKSNDTVRFLEKQVDYKIVGAVIRRHFRHNAESCVPRTQKTLMLVKCLQEVPMKEP